MLKQRRIGELSVAELAEEAPAYSPKPSTSPIVHGWIGRSPSSVNSAGMLSGFPETRAM
ncbi:MAG: hypothetical protein ACYC91_04245 [Solirubrobacteraceae bacterium]